MTKEERAAFAESRRGPEIIIGLVGAVGTDLSSIATQLKQELGRVEYTTHDIRLSDLLLECAKYQSLQALKGGPEDKRIHELMSAGDNLRKTAARGDILALLGMSKIRDIRYESHGDSKKPLERVAYIFNSLKHPDEIKRLREVYGQAFFVISVYSPREQRKQRISEKVARSRGEFQNSAFFKDADVLINRDEKELGEEFGQNVRDAFPKGDLFISATNGDDITKQICRFIDILFSHPFKTPTIDEYGMFHAQAAALRSADLSRQVGAVISTSEGAIITTGCNEVPKANGGSVWEDNPKDVEKDYRDFRVGHDASARMKHEIVSEVFEKLKEAKWLSEEQSQKTVNELVSEALFDHEKPLLKNTRVASIIEFGRIVHAEMSAITDAARRGLALKAAYLYCTTFPCHMCARHIIAAGICRVIYIEPYPKSMAKQLYQKSIKVDHDGDADNDAVRFEPFVGVAPQRYMDFFEMPSKRKDNRGYAIEWKPRGALPRIKQFPTYIDIEAGHLSYLDVEKGRLGIVPNGTAQTTNGEGDG